ncbi:MAG: hypothetical protein GY898_14240 [Proteobacteria bacterium]|nr:hypothetical protein [Pseudomonadota bacterium]
MPRRFSIPVLATVAVLSLALVAPASARKRGGQGMAPTEAEQAVHSLKQQIAAEELVVALDLDTGQKSALAEVVADAVAQREAHRAEKAGKAIQVQDLLEDYLAEVQRNGAVSEDTAQALREFRAANRKDPEAHRDARQDTKASLQAILSEDQQQTLRDFRPMSAVGPTDEERAERQARRSQRSERVREKAGERGFDADDIEAVRQMREQRGERKHTRRVVRDVLFSAAFLDALTR